MPLNLEEILALPDIGQKINYLKKGRKTELPDRCKLWDDWNPERHEIMVDKKKYPDRKVLDKESEKVFDEKTGKTYEIEAKYKTEPVNRISIPLEQDIVNIQTAFTVGTEPSMEENMYTLNGITARFTKEEKIQTAKSVLLFLLYINRPHLTAYLPEHIDEIENWRTDENKWILSLK